MSVFNTRRDFFKLSALGFGAAVFASGISACDDVLDDGIRFKDGVASGDPLADRVILWTRVTPDDPATAEAYTVAFEVATDQNFQNIVVAGVFDTNRDRDYTVKVDVGGLSPATSYFYRFRSSDTLSPAGRTKTLPVGSVSQVKLAAVSCSNYPAGRFYVYRELAKQDDLDAILHLGDYIYEYQRGGYASENAPELGRESQPELELLKLDDYRQRYQQYRSDRDLQAVHQAHPFIVVWDDHEVANDAWRNGAENHQEDEGEFSVRKLAALQAYAEWMPIRPASAEDNETIYRSFAFGNLVDLHMLDTRIIGRDEPLEYGNFVGEEGLDFAAALQAIADPERTLLGAEQRDWLLGKLKRNKATWQVLGQQVLMGRMYLPGAVATQQISIADFARLATLAQRAAAGDTLTAEELKFLQDNQALLAIPRLPYNLDAWDAFDAERQLILNTAKESGANLIVLAGDTHNAWANQLKSLEGDLCGMEFATSSVTSPGLESYLGIPDAAIPQTEAQLVALVEGLQYCNSKDRGFLTLTFSPEKVSARFSFVSSILDSDYTLLSDREFVTDLDAVGSKS
ncbi:alkaline phosphatase D family protein [Pseudobacteriovorax antillogorgiicola]|uniref:Alkaline phosphatase D n=1 Tax=Pseudobacteriovorax antillogorgiicola TaxID=1513793 RepID=A0A1Y6BU13_9BACT|nr:alkaline phosphatase D family protein [Pseudobacteriovorax antillogorgiicola]TCS52421.1 alkaline phosphatase D [Pseudobacteriovorax antillogorgiicola]SMF28803.1 alkaline phosphatase D [Pseudobacteriovorax antillogorgiicola]